MSRLLTEAEDRARVLLGDNRNALDAVIAALLEKETISGEELAQIVTRSQGGEHVDRKDGVTAGT